MAGAGQTTNIFTGNKNDYNHDFNAQINNYTGKANEQYNKYNAQYNNAQNYENQYNDAFANRQTYGDFMNQAEDEKGVAAARQAYNDSARAVAATQQAMLALPSTTNRNSNVVLTQAQRNAALNNQMNKYNTTLASNVAAQDVYHQAYQDVLNQAMNVAAGNYQSQQDALAEQMNRYQSAYNVANQIYANALNQENLLRDVYAKMYQDEANHAQMEYNYWYGNLQDKWKQQEIAAQRYAADSALRVQQYLAKLAQQNQKKYKNWDFGNGYSVQENANGQATYLKNGNAISAGQFLEATGAKGANWNLWNDIWNQGVSTRGVGSDTVSAFNRVSPTSHKYNYLFGL